MAILNNSNAISTTGGYDVNNSLRLRSSASAYLSRTPSVTSNRQVFTWSSWVKRGTLGAFQNIISSFGGSGTLITNIEFMDTDALRFYYNDGTNETSLTTTQVFRDPSAWYHIVVSVDTTQGTSSNRIKMYVNGNQITAFSSSGYPPQNSNTYFNLSSAAMNIGRYNYNNTRYFDGYMAEVNFIDGSAKAASDFGETDTTTGVWKPKAYSGTYGTNGFYLKFSDIATTSGSNAGLGKDFSGNTNYWTTNNISVTSGVTYDAMKDSPTNTSATVANYCVANPLDNRGLTISGGNLNLSLATATWYSMRASMAFPSTGKYYWEYTVNDAGYNIVGILDANGSIAANEYIYSTQYGYAWQSVSAVKGNNNSTSAYGSATTTGDVLMIAFDADNRSLFVGKNGTWFNSSNPATNTSPMYSSIPTTLTFFPAFAQYSTASSAINFGQRPFSYTPPTGYVALNTYNLPTPTILQGNKYMDATTYTGTGSSLSVTNAGSFKPDFVWVKGRSGATDHALYDSVRGTTKQLESNTTTAETTESTGLTAFGTNGFTVGALAQMNTSSATYVGWQWQAGQGSNTTNTSGTITSTISVNATAGFSVVTWTGNGTAGATTGHGLGVTPAFVIIKNRTATAGEQWIVWHKSISQAIHTSSVITLNGYTGALVLNGTTGSVSYSFDAQINGSTNGMLAYCWAEISGFSRFGSYTGNGSTDGPFVFTGFRPKFVMLKKTSNATNSNWLMQDTSRETYNANNYATLAANLSSAEPQSGAGSFEGNFIDYLSNGFKIRSSGSNSNESSSNYIYMAFAESPFSTNNRAR